MIITGKKFSKPALSRVINGDDPLPTPAPVPVKHRLDYHLLRLHPQYNRSAIQTFIKAGLVTVDGQLVRKPGALYLDTAQFALTIPTAMQHYPDPPVIYEDSNVLVLSKPAGILSTTKGRYCPEITLEHYGYVVHRLDRDTSGTIILAKNRRTQSFLRRQFQERKAHKLYYAITEGCPELPEAIIDLPLGRNLNRPTTFLIDPDGKPSQTYYRVVATVPVSKFRRGLGADSDQPVLSLIELRPTTGRTHQLRIHLSHLGTPILGDPIYGSGPYHPAPNYLKDDADDVNDTNDVTIPNDITPPNDATTSDNITPNHSADGADNADNSTPPAPFDPASPPRLYLHAASLEITIPGEPNNQRCTFSTPLPPEFAEVFPTAVAEINASLKNLFPPQEEKNSTSPNYSTLYKKSQYPTED